MGCASTAREVSGCQLLALAWFDTSCRASTTSQKHSCQYHTPCSGDVISMGPCVDVVFPTASVRVFEGCMQPYKKSIRRCTMMGLTTVSTCHQKALWTRSAWVFGRSGGKHCGSRLVARCMGKLCEMVSRVWWPIGKLQGVLRTQKSNQAHALSQPSWPCRCPPTWMLPGWVCRWYATLLPSGPGPLALGQKRGACDGSWGEGRRVRR